MSKCHCSKTLIKLQYFENHIVENSTMQRTMLKIKNNNSKVFLLYFKEEKSLDKIIDGEFEVEVCNTCDGIIKLKTDVRQLKKMKGY